MLVVENDPEIARALAAELAGSGCRMEWARDGVEALRHLGSHTPDALVLDLDVPLVSGFRVLHVVRRDAATRDLPVVVLSGMDFQEAMDAICELPDYFVLKPAPPGHVAERIRSALARAA